MASNIVIDLLSSDDEAPLPALSPPVAIAPSMITFKPTVALASKDYEDLIQFDEQWEEVPAKRRKLSPSPASEDGIHGLPQLPRLDAGIPQIHASRTKLQGQQDWTAIDESDPIVFTSSLGHKTSHAGRGAVDADASGDSLPEDLFSATSLAKPSALSARTIALLDSLSRPPRAAKPSSIRMRSGDEPRKGSMARSRRLAEGENSTVSEDDISAPSRITKTSRKPTLTQEAKAAQARDQEREKALKTKEKVNAKAASKEQKAKDKEEDQERKRLLKEEKAREKRIAADLAEVNKSKLDKKDSTPEMVVDLPASIDGESVNTQIREFLKNLGVDATLYQSPIPNVIKWRRKMKARWNPEVEYWEPIDRMEIHEEKHVMCIMSAKEFIALAMVQENDQDIETHVARVKSAYEACTPIYLIEGLYTTLKRNKTAENRAYQAKVKSLGPADEVPSSTQAASRKKRSGAEIIDEDSIEDALLRLQVVHGCLVHHTSTSVDTAEWVANFTQHISTIPYRTQRMNLETSFCIESGQVRASEDKDDNFIRMLQEIVRITPSIAHGIASEYPSVISLVNAFRQHGPNVLEDLQKRANRNGALTDRKIGPAISRRLYKVFTELDPASTDV